MKSRLLFFLISSHACIAFSQSTSRPADLAFYADAMVHSSRPEHRERAASEFYRLFKEYVNTAQSSTDWFTDIPWITVIAPVDSTFRVITWQVEGQDGMYRYHGFVQSTSEGVPSLVELNDTRPLKSENGMFNHETWYGAIYYGIQPFETKEKETAYLVLGFNADNPDFNQRVADILQIDEKGVQLGMPVFVDTAAVRSRIIINYSDAGRATMQFDREKNMLIYDHLITITSPSGPVVVADGSYHGFEWKKGEWHFINNVFTLIMDEPPGGKPAEGVRRDLFGRETDKN